MFQNWCYPGCILNFLNLRVTGIDYFSTGLHWLWRVVVFLGWCYLLVCVFWGAWLSHITNAQVGKAKTNNKGRHYKYRQCWILKIYTFFQLNYSVTYSLTLSPSELYATCICVTVCKHCYLLRNRGLLSHFCKNRTRYSAKRVITAHCMIKMV